MAFNGTGTFVRIYNWVTDKINGIPITASRMDAEMDGMATGLSTCITKDGQTTVTANIPMSSHKFTGLSVGNARTDSISLGQVQDGQYTYLGTSGGVADAYVCSPAPSVTAYTETMRYMVKISATNLTTTPYLQLSAIASPASNAVITKLNASKAEIALEPSDMIANGLYSFQRNSANSGWVLLNPEKSYDKYLILDSAAINNLGIAASVGSNALTISLKTKAGTDPTAIDPVKISFRNSTLTNGTYNTRSATSALSITISSGSTLGTVNAVQSTIYLYALDNAGTIELGVSLTPFADNSIQSSTAEGGSGGADSATVLYSTTARSNVPVRVIGKIVSTQATAGTWVTSPSNLNINGSTAILLTDFVSSKTSSGYTKFPDGTVLQWGLAVAGGGNKTLVLPLAFPTAFIYVNLINNDTARSIVFETFINNLASFDYEAVSIASTDPRWFAIGY